MPGLEPLRFQIVSDEITEGCATVDDVAGKVRAAPAGVPQPVSVRESRNRSARESRNRSPPGCPTASLDRESVGPRL